MQSFYSYLFFASLAAMSPLCAQEYWVYFGTYTHGNRASQGIYASGFNSKTGRLSEAKLVAEIGDPSFLALHPSEPYLYSVSRSEATEGEAIGGVVSAFRVDIDTAMLVNLNERPSGGKNPCHIAIDGSGSTVLVANYSSGHVASYQIQAGGALSEPRSLLQHVGGSVDPKRQRGPHPHSTYFSPNGQRAYAVDLGIDQIVHYRLESGKLKPDGSTQLEPGAGPRHMALHPNGRLAFSINELNNTITSFSIDSKGGQLTLLETVSSIPVGYAEKNSTAEIQVHVSGKFLYGSNRGHDSIVVYAINSMTGELSYVENFKIQGSTPRNFRMDSAGRFLLVAGQHSNTVEVLSVDADTGRLSATDQVIEVPAPVCVVFLKR